MNALTDASATRAAAAPSTRTSWIITSSPKNSSAACKISNISTSGSVNNGERRDRARGSRPPATCARSATRSTPTRAATSSIVSRSARAPQRDPSTPTSGSSSAPAADEIVDRRTQTERGTRAARAVRARRRAAGSYKPAASSSPAPGRDGCTIGPVNASAASSAHTLRHRVVRGLGDADCRVQATVDRGVRPRQTRCTRARPRAVAEVRARAHGPVLEVMCGSGRFLVPLAAAGIDIDGIDASEDMLAACARKCAEHGVTAGCTASSCRSSPSLAATRSPSSPRDRSGCS